MVQVGGSSSLNCLSIMVAKDHRRPLREGTLRHRELKRNSLSHELGELLLTATSRMCANLDRACSLEALGILFIILTCGTLICIGVGSLLVVVFKRGLEVDSTGSDAAVSPIGTAGIAGG